MTEKVRAVSMYRYRGGAAEKRLYGGQGTVTEFWIYFGDEKEPVKMRGHGATPGQRKTDAVERAKALRGKTTMQPNPPTLTPSQSKRRVTELRKQGCEVKRVKLPSGETVVLKKCGGEREFIDALRDYMGKSPLKANPEGGGGAALFALGALAVAGGVIWYVSRPSEAKAVEPSAPPPSKKCASLASLEKFAKANSYKLYVPPDTTTTPMAQWPTPSAEYSSDPKARSYSLVDCAFAKWDGTKWVTDAATATEFAAWVKSTTVAGHPISMFLP